jgi:predicted DNA-binding protein
MESISFRVLFDSTANEIIEEPSGYHMYNHPPYVKRHKPNSGKGSIDNITPQYNTIFLQSGKIMNFKEEDGNTILTPEWVVWNPCVRKIIQRLPKTVSKRLKYLSYFMGEEEGYDENDQLLYEYLEDDVWYAYLVEMRLKHAMRNVLQRWRCYQINKKSNHADVDPITLSEPVKPVVLYSWKNKRKYVFDAKSISLHIETQLLHQSNGFATPLSPRNPWSNIDFTHTELISLYLQIKRYGELRWGLYTLYQTQFDKHRWLEVQRNILVSKALKQGIFETSSIYIRDLIEDFIMMMLVEAGIEITPYHQHIYHLGLIHLPEHWYLQKWKQLCIQYTEPQQQMISYHIILENVRALIKKQYYLINELMKQGHLPKYSFITL